MAVSPASRCSRWKRCRCPGPGLALAESVTSTLSGPSVSSAPPREGGPWTGDCRESRAGVEEGDRVPRDGVRGLGAAGIGGRLAAVEGAVGVVVRGQVGILGGGGTGKRSTVTRRVRAEVGRGAFPA